MAEKLNSTSPLSTEHFLCKASVFHRRLTPTVHHFNYKVYYLFFPLKFVTSLNRFWLSIDRFNLFSFYHRDHGSQTSSLAPLDWLKAILTERGFPWFEEGVWLLTFPRVLGYVFSPLSLWFCYTPQKQLFAVLAEVNNTFKERHSYLLLPQEGTTITPDQWLSTQKNFHVSPFLKIEGEYQFRFDITQNKIGVWINYHVGNEKILETSILGQRSPLTNATLIETFCRSLWMTLGVILRIHYHAFKLWRKKVPFHPKPPPPHQEISS